MSTVMDILFPHVKISTQCLISLSILALLFIFQHIEVGGIATLADVVLLHSFTHGTSWLCAMGAVAIFTLVGELENLWKVVAYFLHLHVEGTKALDAWSVDDVASIWHFVHLRESGGVHTFVVRSGDDTCASLDVKVGQQGIDEGGFAHA